MLIALDRKDLLPAELPQEALSVVEGKEAFLLRMPVGLVILRRPSASEVKGYKGALEKIKKLSSQYKAYTSSRLSMQINEKARKAFDDHLRSCVLWPSSEVLDGFFAKDKTTRHRIATELVALPAQPERAA